ncbi:hypothetical protein AB4402_08780 [Vibrio breoganii]|uniref:Uncharacterized protein n=1 Tax=Vibrio breoganii TaxID=553239 RepID=A0AAP8N169_9VIBR|nr:hypothetical protein [Vibrio breoganii]PMP14068.1 hypothetical protein BCS93_04575 [Vibrio breoganii]
MVTRAGTISLMYIDSAESNHPNNNSVEFPKTLQSQGELFFELVMDWHSDASEWFYDACVDENKKLKDFASSMMVADTSDSLDTAV